MSPARFRQFAWQLLSHEAPFSAMQSMAALQPASLEFPLLSLQSAQEVEAPQL
jgi:hypothetical protein